MDPLSAIGLVANVLSFVDFGLKLLGKAREIARSAEGAPTNHLDLELVTKDLQSLTGKLHDGAPKSGLQV